MPIYKALLKHGHSKFSLEILEYCKPTQCTEREQYYIDLLKPHYNILKTAGSSLGFKHSEQSLVKISKALTGEKNPMYGKIGENSHLFGRKLSEQTRAKLSIALTGEKNPRYGKKKAEGSGSPSVKIKVLDIITGISTIYNSMSEAAKAIGCPSSSISGYFFRKRQTPFKKRYLLEKLKQINNFLIRVNNKFVLNYSEYTNYCGVTNKNRAGVGKTIHSIPLLRAKTFDYNSNGSIHLKNKSLNIRHNSTLVSKDCKIKF